MFQISDMSLVASLPQRGPFVYSDLSLPPSRSNLPAPAPRGKWKWKSLSYVRLCDPMDCQAPLSMEFSKQEEQSELPFPSPGKQHYLSVATIWKIIWALRSTAENVHSLQSSNSTPRHMFQRNLLPGHQDTCKWLYTAVLCKIEKKKKKNYKKQKHLLLKNG